jgi:hypothetical protein
VTSHDTDRDYYLVGSSPPDPLLLKKKKKQVHSPYVIVGMEETSAFLYFSGSPSKHANQRVDDVTNFWVKHILENMSIRGMCLRAYINIYMIKIELNLYGTQRLLHTTMLL